MGHPSRNQQSEMEERCRENLQCKGLFRWPCNLVDEGKFLIRKLLQDSTLDIH
jgi:hypothetical protein